MIQEFFLALPELLPNQKLHEAQQREVSVVQPDLTKPVIYQKISEEGENLDSVPP